MAKPKNTLIDNHYKGTMSNCSAVLRFLYIVNLGDAQLEWKERLGMDLIIAMMDDALTYEIERGEA